MSERDIGISVAQDEATYGRRKRVEIAAIFRAGEGSVAAEARMKGEFSSQFKKKRPCFRLRRTGHETKPRLKHTG
ncbi:hypothetical protein J2129_001932 [Methanofollis sp. W23]|nr:hypothetical protein [Methanofollis sp. W23]